MMSSGLQRFAAWRRGACFSVMVIFLAAKPAEASSVAGFDPALVFENRCSACHTVGGGTRIGPDLAAVTERRQPDWLVAFIQSSQTLIASGDPTARQLFEQFNGQRMPDHELTPEAIHSLLAYIEAGGPGEPVPQFLPAVTADASAIQRGKELFAGRQRFAAGGIACASCHTLQNGPAAARFLGGSLARVFSKYQDVELASTLEGVRLAAGFSVPHAELQAADSLAVRGFLRQIDVLGGDPDPWARAFPALGVGLGVVLIGLCVVGNRRRLATDASKAGAS